MGKRSYLLEILRHLFQKRHSLFFVSVIAPHVNCRSIPIAVVVAQLAEWLLLIPKVYSSNPVFGKIL